MSNFCPNDVSCELLVVIIELIAFVFPVINPLNPSDCKTYLASEPAISKIDEHENKPDTCKLDNIVVLCFNDILSF